MAFLFNSDKSKAEVRTETKVGIRPSLSDGEVTVSFPMDDNEIVLALMSHAQEEARWRYISDANDETEITRAYHSMLDGKLYVTCRVVGTIPSERPIATIKAVFMKID